MKLFLIISIVLPLFSCLSSPEQGDFFVSEILPKSGEFENMLRVSIRFSKPVNKKNITPADIRLLDIQNIETDTEISNFEINETGDILTVYSENVEPDRYYRLMLKGDIMSEDNLLLSYYYGGNFVSEDTYFIKKKKNTDTCLVINEVLSYPSENYNYEFIELFNCSENDTDLRGYYIKIDENRAQKLLFRNNSFILPKGAQRIILSDVKEFTEKPLIYVSGKFGKNGLSNTSLKSIRLFSEEGRLLSEFRPFSKARKGISFERINPYRQSDEKNWGYSVSDKGSTPDSQNSIFMKDIFPPSPVSVSVRETETGFEIIAEFDEDVECSSQDCLYLLSQEKARIQGISTATGKTVILKPLLRLKYSNDYSLVATPTLKDIYQNSFATDSEVAKIRTPEMPSIRLSYPSSFRVGSNTRFFEFISQKYSMDTEKVYLRGEIQLLSMLCTKGTEEGRFLCTIKDQIQGEEEMCLFINDADTGICMLFSKAEETNPPYVTIRNILQIKDYVYIEADSSVPCLLFADFLYKEDLDETFSYSSYSFMQHFEYKIRIQDSYKEYLAEIYCLDLYNNPSAKTKFSTESYSENGTSLIINEVLPNPSGADTSGEFIEIINNGTTRLAANLISVSNCSDKTVKISRMSKSYIMPKETALIVSYGSVYFGNEHNCTVLGGADRIIGRDLRNSSPETLCLYYNGLLLDYFNPKITSVKEGLSITRVSGDVYFDSANWTISSLPGGSPCLAY